MLSTDKNTVLQYLDIVSMSTFATETRTISKTKARGGGPDVEV